MAGPDWALQAGVDTVGREACVPKRLVDLFGTVALGFLASPVIVIAALSIRLSSKGPILYKQARIGRGSRTFTALKFRTMWMNADEGLNDHLTKDPSLRQQWQSLNKLKNDPRVTPIGMFLRRFSLDELPQLWNIWIGDMSLVGPRPIVETEIEKYGQDYAAYERVRPGLTGLWQVSGRNDTTYQQRVDYDSYYVQNWSLWLDAKILARTVRAVISGVGAY
ncbi:MAG: sugar transferase [Bryobacteraceae bacterium]